MAEEEIYYEMLWDCAQCHTTGLLGDSHRHCPTCGAAQDPARRYFPKPGEEIEAKNHQFVGADWHCAYCSSPNSAAAAHCTNCGAGQDGTKPVALIADTAVSPPPTPQPAPVAPKSHGLRWGLALLALVLLALGVLFSTTRDTTATVSQRSWVRDIQIERMASVSDAAWCDGVPADAYAVTRTREERSTRRIEDGQDCHDERLDKGDGTFVKKHVCSPRYRQEPVYADRCHFQVNRWRSYRTVKAGPDNSAMPVWPSVGTLSSGLNALGAEREGPRHESYELTLASGGKTWTCNVPETVWAKYTEGSTAPIKVRMTGGADCGSLH